MLFHIIADERVWKESREEAGDISLAGADMSSNNTPKTIADNSVLRLVQALAPAVSYKESNLETNRKVWDMYAKVRCGEKYDILAGRGKFRKSLRN